ncbi:hypothetical protein [Bdellovibrio sp. HCB274]|uniref:hypothetical protein n=1 Tax=Bdellovibrio sp. HCB274 TaxID=3394361 RepID=UPI0039B67A3B
MAENKSQNDNSKLLAVLLFLGAGLLVLLSMGTETKSKNGPGAVTKTPTFEKSVNKHLMLTNEKMEFQRRRMEIENSASADFNRTKEQATYNPQDSGLDLSNDSRSAETAAMFGRGDREEGVPSNPHDVIQRELFNAEQDAAYSEAYKKEYARQFVENAAKGGYNVILDDQYRVRKVTPINRKPGTVDIFNSDGGAIQ